MTLNHILRKYLNGNVHMDQEFVDMKLPSGTLWATSNLGARTPYDIGKYFYWGDTIGFNGDDDVSAHFSSFTTKNLFYLDRQEGITKTLEEQDDAAHIQLGGLWSMPTKKQLEELAEYTTVRINRNDPNHKTYFIVQRNGQPKLGFIVPISYSFVKNALDRNNTSNLEAFMWTKCIL